MNKIIIIAILSIFLISGCANLNGNDSNTIDEEVYRGTQGLEIEFLTDSPPKEVYEGEYFQVVALLKNKGAYPITLGRIVLSYEEDYLDPNTYSQIFTLDGKDMYTPIDDEVVKSFVVETKNIENMSFIHSSLLLVTVCYDYATKLSTEVCIDTDPHSIKLIEKACEAETESFSGQGGPVKVKRVEQKMLSSNGVIRPQFKIYIENAGSGEVVGKDSVIDICSSRRIEKGEINGVTLKEIRFSDYSYSDMTCLPEKLKLVQGEDYFVCTLKEASAIREEIPSFMTTLYMEFEYGYTETKSKEIDIKKLTT